MLFLCLLAIDYQGIVQYFGGLCHRKIKYTAINQSEIEHNEPISIIPPPNANDANVQIVEKHEKQSEISINSK